jgi:oligopeptide transport system substrate-binding protein
MQVRHIVRFAILAAVVVTGLAMAQSRLVYNSVNDLGTWQPNGACGLDQSEVIYSQFEGLVRPAPDGAIVPGVAESWEISDDGLTWTFHLRDDARWSDGESVTAFDFEHGWIHAITPGLESCATGNYNQVVGAMDYLAGNASREDVGITVHDERTISITTISPVPFLLEIILHQSWMPTREDVVDGDLTGTWILESDKWIGNGPFRLINWQAQDRFVFEKNEYYWNADQVHLDELVYRIIPDANTSLAAFRSGQVDVIKTMPASEIAGLLAAGTATSTPLVRTMWYSINLGEATASDAVKDHLWDVRVRQAMQLAINRTLLTDVVLRAGDVPADGYIPCVIRNVDGDASWCDDRDAYFPVEGDIERAQALLAEAGYPGGEGLPEFEILYNIDARAEATALTLQDMWEENLGIRTRLLVQETQVFAGNRGDGIFEITRGGLSGMGDPSGLLGAFRCGQALNMSIWCDEEYDRLFALQAETLDPEERFGILYEMERMLVEGGVVIPLYTEAVVMALQPNVSGVYTTGRGAFLFDQARVD